MKNIPTVTVITRTKDRPLLLQRALESVMTQSLKDFEMIIVNDGGNPKVVEELIKRNKDLIKDRVTLIHNKSSLGMQQASNKGLKASSGKYVVIHDDDDSWHPDFLKLTTALMEEKGSKGVVTVTDKVEEEVTERNIKYVQTQRLYPGLESINLYKLCAMNYAAPISFIYRREVFKEIGYYDETLGGVGDWDFALRFIQKYDIEFLKTPHALANYHQRLQATGIDANSIFTDTHRKLENMLINRYLREELKAGKLGIGYIISSLRYQDEMRSSVAQHTDHITVEQAQELARLTQYNIDQVAKLERLITSQPPKLTEKVKRRLASK